ncbi:MAG: hypothetical protein FJ291_23090 [Planctomycetes bacterium]|nr:hypothetical protein [Planctomycetota bacterium]
MGYRYEYEETDTDVAGMVSVLDALLPGPSTGTIAYKCTIYDDETGEELATGYGWSKTQARDDAEGNL